MSWYDNKTTLVKHINERGLKGLNEIADFRHNAHYDRRETLEEFVFLGCFWGDTCGNFGKIGWNTLNQVPAVRFPIVATKNEWFAFVAENNLEMPMVSLSMELPPEYAKCDICGKSWSIEDCSEAVVVRQYKDIPLNEYVSQNLTSIQEALRNVLHTTVFMQPDMALHNSGYKELSVHPKYSNVEIRKGGFVYHPDQDTYLAQPGDVGHYNIWYYRHPSCQQAKLETSESVYFADIFRDAGFKDVVLTQIKNEYCGDPTCCGPWFMVQTKHGNFKIGWRKRVINIELLDGLKEKLDLDVLFSGEQTTKGKTGIHAWGAAKAVEYLKTINNIQAVYS